MASESPGRRRRLVLIALIFGVTVVLRFVVAAIVPIVQDETYYLEWSRTLDFGYFDHPPMVAWLGVTTMLEPASAFLGRLGGVIVAAAAFPFMVGLLRRSGVRERRAFLAGLVLFGFNLYGLVFGVLATPDVGFIVFWTIALHEAAAALDGSERRWLTAGVATGLGLLSKYIMCLIGPVFLLGLIGGRPRSLRTAWPYLGGLVALLVFAPHLWWNNANEWVPIRFQLGNGFQGSHEIEASFWPDLPLARHSAPGSAASTMGAWFEGASVEPPDIGGPEPVPAPESAAAGGTDGKRLIRFLQRTSEYAGAVLMIWGAFIPLVVHFLIGRWRGKERPEILPHVRPLLLGATWFPILFFGVVSLSARVEANWPAEYMVGASVLLAGFAGKRLRHVLLMAGINVVLVGALAVYCATPGWSLRTDRIRWETDGFAELALHIARLDGPVFVDRHQLGGEMKFHQQSIDIVQWPGLTRPSEFVRRAAWAPYDADALRAMGGFWTLSGWATPAYLEGFAPVESTEFRDCLGTELVITKAFSSQQYAQPCADERTSHVWYLVRYVPVR